MLEIGDTFVCEGKTLVVVKTDFPNCGGCYLRDKPCDTICDEDCIGLCRSDFNDVIFKECEND